MSAVSHRPAGLDELRRRIGSLPAVAEAAVAPALLAVAETVADDVRTALPDQVGPLAASVSAGRTAEGSAVTVAAPFARFLEYGTFRRAARPFLRPVALRAGEDARALLAAALRRGLAP